MSGQAPTHPPGAGEGGGDPSMEDILASIRRILSEDEAPPAPPEPPPPPPPPSLAVRASEPPPPPAVLELDASMLVEEEPETPLPPAVEVVPMPGPELLPALHAARPVEPPPTTPAFVPEDRIDMPPPPEPFAEPPPVLAAHSLVAPEAAAAAASSVGSLLRSIGTRQNVAVRGGGPTIEDLVRDELRPALKAWLDVNLPPLVERLVRAEIERVVGRVDL